MLERKIGGFHATMLVMGAMVGSGILVTPAIVATSFNSTAGALLLWALGALYALTGALSQAELAAIYPEAGGDYVFLRNSFGRLVAFLSGWVSLTIGFAGSIAVLARSCAQYLLAAGLSLPEGWPAESLLAILLIAILTAINSRGLSHGSWTQSVLTVAKIAGLALLATLPLALSSAPAATPATATAPLWAAFLPVVFTYSGWNDSIYLGGEIRDPGRNLPRSLIGGTAAVAAIYLTFNYAFLQFAATSSEGHQLAAASVLASAVLGEGAGELVSALAALLLLGTIATLVMTGPRIAYAMSADGALPSALARTSRTGVPANALRFQAAVALLFVAVGTLQEIIAWVGFALVLFSALATACLFVERARHKPSPYRTPAYPLPPLFYVVCSLIIAGWVGLSDPLGTAKGLLFVVAGVPVYWLTRR